FRQSCNSILRCPSISDGRLSYQFSSDGYIRRSVYAYREFGECKGKKHYHLMLLVNRDTWCRAGDYRAPGSLAGMIKQAWCSALGVDAGRYDTLAHFPVRPAVWLERDDDTGFQQVLERADYLAKESTKAYGTGERNFGCSRG
ncbi:inovirus-type Gp2 protein, partial [Escherichia coli]|nr:inovirus-type Gp2 protein [Escherichia coli]MDL6016026.1 inovirus-type Gp2 protein [Escherichia coli]